MPYIIKLIFQIFHQSHAPTQLSFRLAHASTITNSNYSTKPFSSSIFTHHLATQSDPPSFKTRSNNVPTSAEFTTRTPHHSTSPSTSSSPLSQDISTAKTSKNNPPDAFLSSSDIIKSLSESLSQNQSVVKTPIKSFPQEHNPTPAQSSHLAPGKLPSNDSDSISIPHPALNEPISDTSASSSISHPEPVNFRAENIGAWAARQEDFFAQQNRDRIAESERRRITWHKYRPAVVILACFIFFSLNLWGMTTIIVAMINRPLEYIPTIANDTFEEINNYTDYLQEIHDSNPNNQNIIQDIVDKTLSTSSGAKYNNEVLLAQMRYLFQNNLCQEMIAIKDRIDANALAGEDRIGYYNMLTNCYYGLDNEEEWRKYSELGYELSISIRAKDFTNEQNEEN